MPTLLMVSEPTSGGLLVRGVACLNSFKTYLKGTVGLGCNLFKWFPILPTGDCGPRVQPVYTVSKPTYCWSGMPPDLTVSEPFQECNIAKAVFIV